MEKTEIIQRAIQNGTVKAGIKDYISVYMVVMKLADCTGPDRHQGVKMDSKSLLEEMATRNWDVVEGVHPTDKNYHGVRDENPHILVEVNKGRYHLRVDSREHIYMITGPQDSGVPPWASPGSHAERKRRF